MFCPRLLKQFNEKSQESGVEGAFTISPIVGSIILTNVGLLACIAAFWTIQKFGRRTLFIWGQLAMAILLFFAGLCLYLNQAFIAFIAIALFVIAYQISQGSVAWLYCPEVTPDESSGFCLTAQFVFMLQLSMSFEYKLKSDLDVHGTFWFFSAMSLLGFFFMIMFVKESSGLTDIEKKSLYTRIGKI